MDTRTYENPALKLEWLHGLGPSYLQAEDIRHPHPSMVLPGLWKIMLLILMIYQLILPRTFLKKIASAGAMIWGN